MGIRAWGGVGRTHQLGETAMSFNRSILPSSALRTAGVALAGVALALGGSAAWASDSARPGPTTVNREKPNPPAHQEEADGCDHGATGKACRPDPQPDKGKECQVHGNHGGINEDHCAGGGPSTPDEDNAPDDNTNNPGNDTKPQDPGGNTDNDTEPQGPGDNDKPKDPGADNDTDDKPSNPGDDAQNEDAKPRTPAKPGTSDQVNTNVSKPVVSKSPSHRVVRVTAAPATRARTLAAAAPAGRHTVSATSLPYTGSESLPIALGGLALVTGGAGLVIASRRRRVNNT